MSITSENAGSLPPGDRDEPARTRLGISSIIVSPTPRGMDSLRPDEALQQRVRGRLASGITQTDVARSARVQPSALNKWLNNRPDGDWRKLEWILNKWDADFDERIDLKRENARTMITDWIGTVVKIVTRTNDLGIITGPAGVGKTCGFQLYCADNPAAILITAGQCHGGAASMVNDLWEKSHSRRRLSEVGLSRHDILVRRFKNTDSPVLIDEFDKLTKSGLRWVKTFHDMTDCPMVLAGNKKGLDNIKALPDEDQATSRVGQNRDMDKFLNRVAYAELAGLIIKQYAPQHADDLRNLAVEVCSRRGHGRRLKKQLRLMLEILDGGLSKSDAMQQCRADGMTDPQIAFKLAATQLLTLEEE